MHRLGDVVDVRLVEAQPIAGALQFELLSGAVSVPRGRNLERSARGRAKERPGRSPREKKRKMEKKSGKAKKGKSWR
jgi:ribonuclease R